MNKKNKQYVPLCFLAAVILFVVILFVMVKQPYEEYSELSSRSVRQGIELQNLEKRIGEVETANEQDELKLKSIKPVYEAKGTNSNNLAIYGTMFEDIIGRARANGLMIRSIEYDMRPGNDPLFAEYSDIYNVCELRFFLVGTYEQFQAFLGGINNNFEYLTSISKLNITAFSSNTDYLLINFGITLYSKKPGNK